MLPSAVAGLVPIICGVVETNLENAPDTVGRNLEDQYLQPLTSAIDRGVEHPFTDGLEAAEAMVLSEKGLELAFVWEFVQLNDNDAAKGDRGGVEGLNSAGDDALHTTDGRMRAGATQGKVQCPPSARPEG